MRNAGRTGRGFARRAVPAISAAVLLLPVTFPVAAASSAFAASSWPPAPGKAVAFQRVPAGAGVLYSRPVAGRCPLGFAPGVSWDRSNYVNEEMSGKYVVDDFGNSRFFSKTAGHRVTMVTPSGRLVRPKALLHKGDRVCRRTDPQGNKPIADPAGTIMGLPAGFPAHPSVDDVKALGLSTATRTVPTFQVPQPAAPRSPARLPAAVTLGSVQSVVSVGSSPHVPTPEDGPAPYGFSPDRIYDITFTYRIAGGSGVMKLARQDDAFTTPEHFDAWTAAEEEWARVTGFTDANARPGAPAACCERRYDALPLTGPSVDLTMSIQGAVSPGVPLLADGSPRPGSSGISTALYTMARGTFDDFGQEYVPVSATWGWAISQDYGAFDPKVNAGCHPLTTGASSCGRDPSGKGTNSAPALGAVFIPVGAR